MEKILFTDLDWTVLKDWKLSEENNDALTFSSKKWVEVILSTWKGLPRVNPWLREWISSKMILENWAKLFSDWKIIEKKLEKNQYVELIKILNILKTKIEFLFFYDSKDNNKAHFYVNQDIWINDEYINKFNWILATGVIHNLDDLPHDIISSKHNIWLLNIKVLWNSTEELWIWNLDTSLKMVFNEWMLNIGVADKWDFTDEIIWNIKEDIKIIVVAGNDRNDLPLMNKVIEVTKETNIQVWLIIVWNLINRHMLKDWNPNVTVINIDKPEMAYLWINHYFSNN